MHSGGGAAGAGLAAALFGFCQGFCGLHSMRAAGILVATSYNSAGVSVVPHARYKGMAWHPLHMAQRLGIRAALQDSRLYHGTLATWGRTPGLGVIPWCERRRRDLGSHMILCDGSVVYIS